MPTYAILGATGKTGGALVDLLVQAPNTHINAYIRSKAKLLTQRPAIENTQNVKIFEGSLSDIPLIASTLVPEVDAAFCVLGSNENIPGIRIAQDTANSVIAALCHIREKDTNYKPPKLIFLSSGSLNPVMSAKLPAAGKWIIDRGMSHVYADLWFAEDNLRLHKSWLDVTFVQPSALTEDVQKGHKLSLDKMAEDSPFVSYLDLAAGMIEIAKSGSYVWMGVSVVATGKDVKFERNAPPQILRGLVWQFAPWLYAPCQLGARYHPHIPAQRRKLVPLYSASSTQQRRRWPKGRRRHPAAPLAQPHLPLNNRSRLRPNRHARSHPAASTSGETNMAVVPGKETYHRKSRLRGWYI